MGWLRGPEGEQLHGRRTSARQYGVRLYSLGDMTSLPSAHLSLFPRDQFRDLLHCHTECRWHRRLSRFGDWSSILLPNRSKHRRLSSAHQAIWSTDSSYCLPSFREPCMSARHISGLSLLSVHSSRMPLSHKVQSAIKSRADALARTLPPISSSFPCPVAPMPAFQKTVLSLYPLQTPCARCPWARPGGCACSGVYTLPRRSELAVLVSSVAVESVASVYVKARHDTFLSVSDDLGIDSPPPLPAMLYLVRITQSLRNSQSSGVVIRAYGNCSLVPRLAVMTTSE